MEQHAVEVRDVDPETAALSTLPQRRIVPLEIRHLDVARGTIHGAVHSPEREAVLPGE
jgi:hypothetical protein